MNAIKIEIILKDDINAEYFIQNMLPRLKEEHKFKHVHYHKCEYFEK